VAHQTGLVLTVADTSSDRNAARLDGAVFGGPAGVWVLGRPGESWKSSARKTAECLEAVVKEAAAALLKSQTDTGMPAKKTRAVLREMLLSINRMNVENRFVGTLKRNHILEIFEGLRSKAGLDEERLFDEWRDW
jgi:alkylhydroperoxidase family enzyme